MLFRSEKVFETCSLIAIPTTPSTAFKLNSMQDPIELYMQDIFTISSNLAGLPTINLPAGFDKNNSLPMGIQLIGPQLHDDLVIKSGFAFCNHSKHYEKIPPLFDKEV